MRLLTRSTMGFTIMMLGTLLLLSLVVTHAFAAKSGTLTWTANVEADLAGYKVYRDNLLCSQLGPKQFLAQVGKVTTYTDSTIPDANFVISYNISAINTSGQESVGRSNCVEKTFYVAPTVGVLTAGSSTLTSITFSLSQVSDGAGGTAKWDVRYAVAPALTNGGWATATAFVCATATCTIPGLQAGTNYEVQGVTYRGTAPNAVLGPLSNVLVVATTKATPPAAPQGLEVAGITTDGNALLSWEPAALADNYEVKRMNTTTNQYMSFSPKLVTVLTQIAAPLATTGVRRFQVCANNSGGSRCNTRAGVWASR